MAGPAYTGFSSARACNDRLHSSDFESAWRPEKVLLHSCCAPCSGEVMEAMLASGVEYTIFFYNPNIHPEREYLLRKDENVRFAEKHNVPFVDADYDKDNWFARARGMEWEPERGVRCTMCFDMR
jgi:predicted adenine nucleotide alpha hydrolase (AANH) superfamily ATPase